MKKSRYSDGQILAIFNQNELGSAVPNLCREHRMSHATFYKWRSKYGGMDASLMKRMKELGHENRCLSLHRYSGLRHCIRYAARFPLSFDTQLAATTR